MVDRVAEIQHVVIIVKRFACAHDDDMRNPVFFLVQLQLHSHDLRDHFAAGQIPLFFQQTAGAERAAHVAADLRGYA